jgi:hypothetical protein
MLVRVRRPRAVELFANGAIYFLETVWVGRCEWVVGQQEVTRSSLLAIRPQSEYVRCQECA